MPAFPSINATGVITQLGWSKRRTYRTVRSVLPCGISHAYALRTYPISSFTLRYDSITGAELKVLEDFFSECEGRLKEFSFTEPDNGVVRPVCRFDSDELAVDYVGPDEHRVSVDITEYRP